MHSWGRDVRDHTGHSSGDDRNPFPKHHQVYLVLRQQILEGLYDDTTALPNEMQLCDQFDVSRITIRKAMERLEREGLVERHRGRGTFPRPGFRDSPVQASISGSIENLIAMGLKTEVRVESLVYVAAPPDVAAALDLAPGTLVQKVVRVRSHQGRPFSHLTTWVPEDLGRTFDRHDLTSQPLLRLLERAGARIDRAEQAITAKLAAPDVARLLETDPGEALLCIRRVVWDKTGRRVEYITGLYRPDTYEHQMSFERRTRDGKDVWST
ncbi:GntR family transcriptional regulator [Caenispirillum bisanense]|uniref:GntR family transcriptional regulator n=1 Tax=Caenispirillum bisanense TaxID=414052 RepID=A0A286GEB4_9PROT|nr:GntR family transcriptional regulator [Caenispirillum bisanense]